MERLELHLKGSFVAIMVILGLMSCGLTPLVMWLVSVKDYPKAIDGEGVTLRNGQKVPWSQLTEKKKLVLKRGSQKTVTGLGLVFGRTRVNIAPRVLVEGDRVLPFLSRILREDVTRP